MPNPWDQLFERHHFELEEVCVRKRLSEAGLHFAANHATVKAHVLDALHCMQVDLETFVIAGKRHEVRTIVDRVPLDWWQAFRERWLPAWWLKRYPVRKRDITAVTGIRHLCPHVNVQAEGRHIEFLESKPCTTCN